MTSRQLIDLATQQGWHLSKDKRTYRVSRIRYGREQMIPLTGMKIGDVATWLRRNPNRDRPCGDPPSALMSEQTGGQHP